MLFCNIARCGYHWQKYLDDKSPRFVIPYKHEEDCDSFLSHVEAISHNIVRVVWRGVA